LASGNIGNIPCIQQIPAFTAGGSKDAEIATPTSDDVLFPKIESATPIPLQNQKLNSPSAAS
jgi:hypothetical protein